MDRNIYVMIARKSEFIFFAKGTCTLREGEWNWSLLVAIYRLCVSDDGASFSIEHVFWWKWAIRERKVNRQQRSRVLNALYWRFLYKEAKLYEGKKSTMRMKRKRPRHASPTDTVFEKTGSRTKAVAKGARVSQRKSKIRKNPKIDY